MQKNVYHFILTSLFIAAGTLMPFIFHVTGLLGSIFLPMFWPVTVSAFFLPTGYAVAVGILSPILSTLMTGMPPISPPILFIMIGELSTLAFTVNLLHNKLRIVLFLAD